MPEPYALRGELEGYIRRHEADENAHAAERHRQNNDWAGRLLAIENDIDQVRTWQTAHDIRQAAQDGELKGVMQTLRAGFAIIGSLILGFGGTGLAIWWTSLHH